MTLLDDLEDEGWKIPLPGPEPMDPDHPYDPHEETSRQRASRVAARRAAQELWARVQVEIAKSCHT